MSITGYMISQTDAQAHDIQDDRTHHERVLDRLRDGKPHESWEFYRKDYVGRVSERIRELVEVKGYDIVNTNKNEDGNPKSGCAVYVWKMSCSKRQGALELA